MNDTKRILTDREKMIIRGLNRAPYTVEFIESWINRRDTVDVNAPAALQCMAVHGFMDAVRATKKLVCNGCIHHGAYENELEYGYDCPCLRCQRRCHDNYQPTQREAIQ